MFIKILFFMRRSIFFISIIFLFLSCKKEVIPSLKTVIESSQTNLSDQYIIACAAGMPNGFMGETAFTVSMFFYPVTGASNYKYYETNSIYVSKNDYSMYHEVLVTSIPVFNGYLRRFQLTENKDRWGIVTYEVNDSIRICNPVYIKVKHKPTIWVPQSLNVLSNGINPTFTWKEYSRFDNAIHFNVVSDSSGNLISGTYTQDTSWTFYDLSNVTLNITDDTPVPALNTSSRYNFTLMSVSKDNWVTTFGQKEFFTP